MLIPRAALEAIVDRRVDRAYRRWKRPTVKAGGRLRTPLGELAIDAVTPVNERDLTDADARAAGHVDLSALLGVLAPEGQLYCVRLHHAGDDPRVALRNDSALDATAVTAVVARLDGFDARSSFGPWTRATLAAIAAEPGRRAPDLAAAQGRETKPFKADVRKLKELGLTESLEVGYRLSPRGEVVWRHLSGD